MEYSELLEEFDRLVYNKQFDEGCKLLENRKKELIKQNETYELLAINNELIGFYRKQNEEENCIRTIGDALDILSNIKDQNTEFFGTVYINIATGFSAFSYFSDAAKNFDKAEAIYNKVLDKDNQLFGALYNNIACMYLLDKEFLKARHYYTLAVDLAKRNKSGLDIAMSLVGVADTYDIMNLDNQDTIDKLLMEAFDEVAKYPLRDDYFKFVCSKLQGNYMYYGYIEQAEILRNWIEQ